MSIMTQKVKINGEIVAYEDLFRLADEIDRDFENYGLRLSSKAASILRSNGYTVEAVNDSEAQGSN